MNQDSKEVLDRRKSASFCEKHAKGILEEPKLNYSRLHRRKR